MWETSFGWQVAAPGLGWQEGKLEDSRAGGPEDWKTQEPTLKGRPGTGKTEL